MAKKNSRVIPKRPVKLFLAEWLVIRGMDRHDLAAGIGVDQATVFRWIDGTRRPDTNTIKAVEEELRLPPGGLLRSPQEADQKSLFEGMSKNAVDDVMKYIQFVRSREG